MFFLDFCPRSALSAQKRPFFRAVYPQKTPPAQPWSRRDRAREKTKNPPLPHFFCAHFENRQKSEEQYDFAKMEKILVKLLSKNRVLTSGRFARAITCATHFWKKNVQNVNFWHFFVFFCKISEMVHYKKKKMHKNGVFSGLRSGRATVRFLAWRKIAIFVFFLCTFCANENDTFFYPSKILKIFQKDKKKTKNDTFLRFFFSSKNEERAKKKKIES